MASEQPPPYSTSSTDPPAGLPIGCETQEKPARADFFGANVDTGAPAGYPLQPPDYQQTTFAVCSPSAPPPGYDSTTKAVVVVNQPTRGHRAHASNRPSNYLLLSLINLLCCFFVLGTVALVFSLQVDSAWESGSHEAAHRNAKIAKILNITGMIIGGVIWTAIGVFAVVQLAIFFGIIDI